MQRCECEMKHVKIKSRRKDTIVIGNKCPRKKGSLKVLFALDNGSLILSLFILHKPFCPRENFILKRNTLLCFCLSLCLHLLPPLLILSCSLSSCLIPDSLLSAEE